MKTITIEDVEKKDINQVTILDIRPEDAYCRGTVEGAINIPMQEVDNRRDEIPRDKPVYVLCHTGEWSAYTVNMLEEAGYEAYNIEGGYRSFLRMMLGRFVENETVMAEKQKDIEKSIIKKFRKSVWCKFTKAIREYELVKDGDKIAVCISGGKDSMLMARLFMQLQKHSDFDFKVEYLVMNPGYNEINLQTILNNLQKLSIPAKVVESNIFEIANSQDRSPCFLCAKMRRGALYNFAKQMGCNKIALGHHYDDVIETTLMNLLNSGSFQTMLPKLKSTNFEGMELIRPMYLIREKDIISWKNYHHLQFIQCACRFTENCAVCDNGGGGSQRYATKQLIKELVKNYNPQVEKNIFKSADNVTLDMILGYKEKGKHYSYLDNYDED